MAFRGRNSAEAQFWTQVVKNEDTAKRQWEALTGDLHEAKYF